MESKEKMYIEKRQFVEKLNFGLIMLPDLEAVEYRNISDKYSEYLRITYSGGKRRYIDVTGDSLTAISQEVSRCILGIRSDAEITHETHLAIIEGWFDAAR